MVGGSPHHEEHTAAGTARLWLAAGRAQGLRRRARVLGQRTVDGIAGDLVEITLGWPDIAARWIAGHGPDAVVVEPDWLRDLVVDRLAAAAGHTAGPTTDRTAARPTAEVRS
jgi:proteasome accessory factor B